MNRGHDYSTRAGRTVGGRRPGRTAPRSLRGAFVLAGAVAVLGVGAPPAVAQEPASSTVADANNPLADTRTFSAHNYQMPSLYGLDDATANTFWFRAAVPVADFIVRASLPLPTVPVGAGSESGLGDLNAFAAYLVTQEPTLTLGIGPQLTLPTADEDALGTGKWQMGFAAVAFAVPNPTFQVGGLLTWQTSVGGDDDRPETSLLALQPFFFWQLGGGWYLRNTAVWAFFLETDDYNIPIGLGVGKVVPMGDIVFNLFVEPQYTLLHEGIGQPATQIFIGVNTQLVGN